MRACFINKACTITPLNHRDTLLTLKHIVPPNFHVLTYMKEGCTNIRPLSVWVYISWILFISSSSNHKVFITITNHTRSYLVSVWAWMMSKILFMPQTIVLSHHMIIYQQNLNFMNKCTGVHSYIFLLFECMYTHDFTCLGCTWHFRTNFKLFSVEFLIVFNDQNNRTKIQHSCTTLQASYYSISYISMILEEDQDIKIQASSILDNLAF